MQPSNQNLLEEFIDENEPLLLIAIPCDTVLRTTLCEFRSAHGDIDGLYVMIAMLHATVLFLIVTGYMGVQEDMHASWRELTMRKLTTEPTTYFVKGLVCRWNVHKMRSESSEYVRKATGFFTNSWRIKVALESYFEEVWGETGCTQ